VEPAPVQAPDEPVVAEAFAVPFDDEWTFAYAGHSLDWAHFLL
jgi:hypothetical protein